METNNLFKSFGKGKKLTRTETNDCVVYTRVSSAKQMDGLSLDVQIKAAHEYVDKHKLVLREIFGGTYESAAKDERKEFQRMIKYLKTTRYKISKILVYSLERFSRNENSIWLSSQLRKLGTEVVSITQPIDTSNPAGIMQQKMLFIFGEFDNQLRRQKSMAGVKEHLLQGEWVTAPPVGYDIVKHNKERKIVVNETGQLIKKMFYWKAKERMPNVEIQKRLKSYGLDYCLRRIGEILTNPFYCGKMVHKALEGEVADGKHEKLVSEAIFLEANNIMAEKKLGLQTRKERPEIALKRFILCSNCNQPMRGYIANSCDTPYYKCNTPGCKCNRNANELNRQFESMLDGFKVNEEVKLLIQEQLLITFQEHNASLQENEQTIISQLTDIRGKLDRLEERFILEELTGELYTKYKAKFEKEIEEIEAQKANNKIEMSKLEDYIAFSLMCCCNLSKMWASGDYAQRQELQNALFEGGIVYDRSKDECRSTGDNEFVSACALLSKDLGNFTPDDKKKVNLSSVHAD
ncbi:MAG TPA: recombinase family protein [Bacteroidia bacterium]|jgi:site-specific DNA recombinase|nr:recombinase family protein [Bacteroidia bacterium]